MLKIGIGSSSSHTLAPWLSAKAVYNDIEEKWLSELTGIKVKLFGSLASVGRGHYTSVALPLGLLGKDPAEFKISVDLKKTLGINEVTEIGNLKKLDIRNKKGEEYSVNYTVDYTDSEEMIEKMVFSFTYKNNSDNDDDRPTEMTYYSYGGGSYGTDDKPVPLYEGLSAWSYMYKNSDQFIELLKLKNEEISLSTAIYKNEIDYAQYRKDHPEAYGRLPSDEKEIIPYLKKIAVQMGKLIHDGCTKNRDNDMCYKIMYAEPKAKAGFDDLIGQDLCDDWKTFFSNLEQRIQDFDFDKTLKLIGVFALAVGEQNAALKNVVTAPTNGACGAVPAVLYYYILFHATETEKKWLFDEKDEVDSPEPNKIINFLLTVNAVGGIVKSNANIAGGIGGCQAEIGTASAMGAGAITDALGGEPEAVFQAAEAALEAHLGSTCDPIGGLVEIPCIARNLTAATIAIAVSHEVLVLRKPTPIKAKVSFDEVVSTMQNISENLPSIYKETSVGGLARVKLEDVRKERPDLFDKTKKLEDIMGISMFRSSC
ncbi:MAG: hypothetical protein GY795_30870 [Desulfobacterales bacterium]|nr:hypothetical protein [Desulfobacterales bacterium]